MKMAKSCRLKSVRVRPHIFRDYFYTNIPASGVSERGVLFGGTANYGAYAGFVFAATTATATYTVAHIGSRLCFYPQIEAA